MEDPVREIPTAIRRCAGSATADEQIEAFHHYFTTDASFIHPLCYVPSSPNSLRRVIGIFLFYRGVVADPKFEMLSVAFDENTNHLFVDLLQIPQLRLLPKWRGIRESWAPTIPMHIHFHVIKGDDGKWLIDFEEDAIQPMNILLAFSLTRPIGRIFYLLCEMMGLINCYLFILLGIWRPEKYVKKQESNRLHHGYEGMKKNHQRITNHT